MPAHLTLLDLITVTVLGDMYIMQLLISPLCCYLLHLS